MCYGLEALRFVNMFYIVLQTIQDLSQGNVTNVIQDAQSILFALNSTKIVIKIINKMRRNPIFAGISNLQEYFSTCFMQALREIVNVATTLSGARYIQQLITGVISVYYSIFGIDKIIAAPGRSQEYLSDSFATMYGYGADCASFLKKIEFDNMGKNSGLKSETLMNSIPGIGHCKGLLDAAILAMTASMHVHPLLTERYNQQLKELRYELNKQNYSPKVKNGIKNNIDQIEKIKKDVESLRNVSPVDSMYTSKKYYSNASKTGASSNYVEDPFVDMKERDELYNSLGLESADISDLVDFDLI